MEYVELTVEFGEPRTPVVEADSERLRR